MDDGAPSNGQLAFSFDESGPRASQRALPSEDLVVSDTIRDDARPFGVALRLPLLAALIASAVAAFFVQPKVVQLVRDGELNAGWLLVAPTAFSVVLAVAAIAAWRVARHEGFFSGRAIIQLGMACAFLGLLAPDTLQEYRARTAPPTASVESLDLLVQSKDARVRALVVEVAGQRDVTDAEVGPLLRTSLDDNDPRVREMAIVAIERRAHRTFSTGASAAAAAARADEAKRVVELWRKSPSTSAPRP